MSYNVFTVSRNLLPTILVILTLSCNSNSESNNLTISGIINNNSLDTIYIKTHQNYHVSGKPINNWNLGIRSDNSFKETLVIPRGFYNLYAGDNIYPIYLNKGYDLHITIDDNKIEFSGYGAKENTYNQKSKELDKKLASINTYHHYANLNEDKFLKLTDSIKGLYDKLIEESSFDDNEFKYFLELHSLAERTHKYLTYPFTRENVDENYVKSNSYPDFFKGIDLKNEDYIEVPLFMMNLFTHSGLINKNNLDSINDMDLSHLKYVSTDTTFIKSEKIREQLMYVTAFFNIEHTNDLDTFYKTYYASTQNTYLKNIIEKKYFKLKNYDVGSKPSDFEFKNRNNQFVSLSDLKGNVVYIDIWASWCRPCINEIEYSNKIQQRLDKYDIKFVNICIQTDSIKWRSIIKEKSFDGIQLFCQPEELTDFKKEYLIESLPRYIILDKTGEIIDFNAKKPSDITLVEDLLNLSN
ncbi:MULTISPECIES: TlpA family protein disulfide reductase [Winogradskyella]|uniref:TlpA family protein disulfide reductase n=1 Tax=Winogradskyella TaxID=286104 RepID=UPI0015CE4CA0|nr:MULTISPECIES: TlpA disulfide reductase family protein [Winogradskyella]QXP78689.1 TlpA family protein disulfide reductase [Winogradskyella sp. HaHa_3_26]